MHRAGGEAWYWRADRAQAAQESKGQVSGCVAAGERRVLTESSGGAALMFTLVPFEQGLWFSLQLGTALPSARQEHHHCCPHLCHPTGQPPPTLRSIIADEWGTLMLLFSYAGTGSKEKGEEVRPPYQKALWKPAE